MNELVGLKDDVDFKQQYKAEVINDVYHNMLSDSDSKSPNKFCRMSNVREVSNKKQEQSSESDAQKQDQTKPTQ